MKYIILGFLLVCQFGLKAQTTSVAAHRGKASFVPENTIRGIKKLLPTGIEYIEIDVRTSKDGELIIMHDGNLKLTTNSKAMVNELTLEELKKVKVTGWFNIRFRKNTIPTLEEVCLLIGDWNLENPKQQVYLYVDCKDADPNKLLTILKKHNLSEFSVYYGNDTYLLKLREQDPSLKIMPSLKNEKDLETKIENLNPYAFDVAYSALTSDFVTKIHSFDIKVFSDLLFLNDRKSIYRKAHKMGVDVVQTDRSRKALKLLRKPL